MSQKHLKELLLEDQEPFMLKNYISDRRFQLKTQSPKTTHLQVKKRRPNFPTNLCKKACFFSFTQSPDPTKSPLFPSTTSKPPNKIFLSIQNPSSSDSNTKNNGFGLFGSLLKRLTNRNRNPNRNGNRKREIVGDDDDGVNEDKFSCSYNGRDTSGILSEKRYLDLDLDLDTSCSSQWEDITSKYLCETPFHFILQTTPSSGRRTPDFSSPAESPNHYQKGEKENDDVDSSSKLQREEEEEEEEEKEQCSPVSVLDPPFEDDDDGHVDDRYECSYAIVQKVKQQLLHKLRRFEELAGLDPIELEKRMVEQENEEDEDDYSHQDVEKEDESQKTCEKNLKRHENELVHQVLKSNFDHVRRISKDMNKLVCDLIAEEEKEGREESGKRVCKRLELWKEVESNTIDMMVGSDFEKQVDWLKINEEQVKEMGFEIECCMLHNLVEELAQDLVSC